MNHDCAIALDYYRKVEVITPENHNVVYFIASCLAEMNNYEEALNGFFKLDFLESNSVRAWRGIAWCSFVIDKYEQALKHYLKIIEVEPKAVDYLNAGYKVFVANRL